MFALLGEENKTQRLRALLMSANPPNAEMQTSFESNKTGMGMLALLPINYGTGHTL